MHGILMASEVNDNVSVESGEDNRICLVLLLRVYTFLQQQP